MEERYLYEYDYAKPELTDEFLEHYGVLGMHWGIRKQPKYTGSLRQRIKKKKAYKSRVKALKKARKIKAKVTAEKKEAAKTKEEIMKTKDLKAMKKNLDKFSNSEIQSVLDRIDKEQKFNEYLAKQNKASMSKAKRLKTEFVETAKEGLRAGTDKTIKLIFKNGANIAINEFAKKMAGSKEKLDKEELVRRLFREEKK